MQIYNSGFEFYQSGDWEKATELLQEAQDMLDEIDNPIQKLLEFIKDHKCVKPLNWEGARIIYEFGM